MDSAQQIALAVLIGTVVFLAIVHIFDLRLIRRTRARRWNRQALVADLKDVGQQLQAVMAAKRPIGQSPTASEHSPICAQPPFLRRL